MSSSTKTERRYVTLHASYMMQRAYRINKVEDVKLQYELFNQNREKVGNTPCFLYDAESIQDEQSGGCQATV